VCFSDAQARTHVARARARRYIKYREREGTFPPFPPPDKEEEPAGEAAGDKKDKKDKGKDDKKKEDKGKKDDKKKKDKGAAEDEGERAPPPQHYVNQLSDSYHEWSDKWAHRDEVRAPAPRRGRHAAPRRAARRVRPTCGRARSEPRCRAARRARTLPRSTTWSW